MISSEKWDIKLKWNKHIPEMPQGMKIFPRFIIKNSIVCEITSIF